MILVWSWFLKTPASAHVHHCRVTPACQTMPSLYHHTQHPSSISRNTQDPKNAPKHASHLLIQVVNRKGQKPEIWFSMALQLQNFITPNSMGRYQLLTTPPDDTLPDRTNPKNLRTLTPILEVRIPIAEAIQGKKRVAVQHLWRFESSCHWKFSSVIQHFIASHRFSPPKKPVFFLAMLRQGHLHLSKALIVWDGPIFQGIQLFLDRRTSLRFQTVFQVKLNWHEMICDIKDLSSHKTNHSIYLVWVDLCWFLIFLETPSHGPWYPASFHPPAWNSCSNHLTSTKKVSSMHLASMIIVVKNCCWIISKQTMLLLGSLGVLRGQKWCTCDMNLLQSNCYPPPLKGCLLILQAINEGSA